MSVASSSASHAGPSGSSAALEQPALPPLGDLFARSSKRARVLFRIEDDYDFDNFGDASAFEPQKHTSPPRLAPSTSMPRCSHLPSSHSSKPLQVRSSGRTECNGSSETDQEERRRDASFPADRSDRHRRLGIRTRRGRASGSIDKPGAYDPQQRCSRCIQRTLGSFCSWVKRPCAGVSSRWNFGPALSSAHPEEGDGESQGQARVHPNWKLARVISGHLGWVRCVAVEPGNKWFATGAGDRMIKIWDLASGELKLSLTGHISPVRGIAISDRHPYLFSAGEDRVVKCWDLETNRVIRQYGGHLSGIYSLALHPTLDLIVTGGRDATARVWDMRTRQAVHVLTGHRGTVASVACQASEPQVISGSMDATVKLWDLAAGKSITTLTHHKKSVRALAIHPTQYTFASGSAGGNNIKTWRCPEGTLVNNMAHDTLVNTLSVNADGVLFSGGDDGSLKFFDYATGVPFQVAEDVPQPGSLDAEAGVFCSTFDQTGTRLLTGGADKTIKIYKEV